MARQPFDLAFSIEEDPLIRGLLDSTNKHIEVIVFGIVYSGVLESVDPDDGNIVIVDGNERAVLEIERIESFSVIAS